MLDGGQPPLLERNAVDYCTPRFRSVLDPLGVRFRGASGQEFYSRKNRPQRFASRGAGNIKYSFSALLPLLKLGRAFALVLFLYLQQSHDFFWKRSRQGPFLFPLLDLLRSQSGRGNKAKATVLHAATTLFFHQTPATPNTPEQPGKGMSQMEREEGGEITGFYVY